MTRKQTGGAESGGDEITVPKSPDSPGPSRQKSMKLRPMQRCKAFFSKYMAFLSNYILLNFY